MWLVETDASVKQRKEDFSKVGNLAVFCTYSCWVIWRVINIQEKTKAGSIWSEKTTRKRTLEESLLIKCYCDAFEWYTMEYLMS